MRKIYIDTKISIHGYKDIYATLVLDMHEIQTYYVMVMILILDLSCSCVYMLYTSYECMYASIHYTYVDFSFAYIHNDIQRYTLRCAENRRSGEHTRTPAVTHRSPLFKRLPSCMTPPSTGCDCVSYQFVLVPCASYCACCFCGFVASCVRLYLGSQHHTGRLMI